MQRSSNNDFGIVPYAKVGGIWTIPLDDILDFASEAYDQGLFRIFHDGSVTDPVEFLEIMQLPGNIPVFTYFGGKIVGVCWLNGCSQNHAFSHLLFVKNGWEIAERAGKAVLDYWFSFYTDGKRLFDVLFGVIPSNNQLAVNYAIRCGYTKLGEVPKMISGNLPASILYVVR